MKEFNLSEINKILKRTPVVLSELLYGLDDELIFSNEGENTWSPYDILGHLIHGENTDWIPRANIILSSKEDKLFIPFNRFAQNDNPHNLSLKELLVEFKVLRNKNIEQLHQMKIDSIKLSQIGFHPEFGEVTLKQLLSTWAVHDLSHINQITRVIARNYTEEIGPWKAYISIMK